MTGDADTTARLVRRCLFGPRSIALGDPSPPSSRYPNRTIVPVYLKTGTASIKNLPSPELCVRFVRSDLLRLLKQFSDVFRHYSQQLPYSPAAVATIEFDQDGGYLALDEQGVVDMDATLKRLDVAMSFIKEICRRWPNTQKCIRRADCRA